LPEKELNMAYMSPAKIRKAAIMTTAVIPKVTAAVLASFFGEGFLRKSISLV